MKDKSQIINEMVINAADVMEAKSEYLEMVAKQFDEQGCSERASFFRQDLPKIKEAVELIRKRAGCWA
jgi:hypothetical protein